MIESSPLFRNLQPQEISRILARLQPVSVSGGTRILERGIRHGQLYIIESGRVSVLLHEGREENEGSGDHLIPHIANALAARSRKRVLVLELCLPNEATGPHFATREEQLRPSLLECARDHSLLTRHRASLLNGDDQHYAAFATLFAAPGAPSAEQDAPALLADLGDIAALYDYLLFATTPASLVQAAAEQASRGVLLVPATMDKAAQQFLAFM